MAQCLRALDTFPEDEHYISAPTWWLTGTVSEVCPLPVSTCIRHVCGAHTYMRPNIHTHKINKAFLVSTIQIHIYVLIEIKN